MDGVVGSIAKHTAVGLDEGEYASLSKLLQEFTNIPTIDKAWTFKSETENGCDAMFLINQPNLSSNKSRKSILSSHILHTSGSNSVSFQWAQFPIELTGVSAVVPSPSGSKLLVIRNSEGDSPTHFEIWDPSGIQKDYSIPTSIHGTVYLDGWFEGISWNLDENCIAYVAEEPDRSRPTFSCFGETWKGEGDFEDNWGETYAGKRQPALFVINVDRGVVVAVAGVGRELSVGQVVWAPSAEYLVFVGWPSGSRKFGMKYCSNRTCALYAIKAPIFKSAASDDAEDVLTINLTQSISSALFPRFSPDGKFLVFLSTRSSVDYGAHLATESLHKIEWPCNGKVDPSFKIVDVVGVVMCPKDGGFPGLYCSKFLDKSWLSDGRTMVLSSVWGSTQTILSVDISSGKVLKISPNNSKSSWDVLALDHDNIIAVCSSPIDVPEIKYGRLVGKFSIDAEWNWLDVSSPTIKCSEKASSLLASLEFDILKIPVRDVSENLTEGGRKPFEAIFVSSKSNKHDPLIVILHGGPHDVSLTTFSKSWAFLSSLGYSLLVVNYRGSLGFGQEALQSLPGKVGSQDVNDVLTAIDHVKDKGLADPSKIVAIGISHGGFLATHLIGQAPERFAAAVARNPVCNLALMVGTTDIPDWCFFEAFGKSTYTASPSVEQLSLFYSKSPISHVSKVKTPTLFLLGGKDLRVPVYDGMQYARALKERGVETKIMMFPDDIHPIKIPRSDFESFLNVGLWFNKYCK